MTIVISTSPPLNPMIKKFVLHPTIIRYLLVFLIRFFYSVIPMKMGLPELGQGIQYFRHGRICSPGRSLRRSLGLWHDNFLDSRVRGNDSHAKCIWLRPSRAALRNMRTNKGDGCRKPFRK